MARSLIGLGAGLLLGMGLWGDRPVAAQGTEEPESQADTHLILCREQSIAGEFAQAVESCQQAALLYGQIPNLDRQLHALLLVGIAYQNLDDPEKVVEVLENALTLADDAVDEQIKAGILTELALAYDQLNQPDTARALEQQRQTNPAVQAEEVLYQGLLHYEANELPEALQSWEQALALYRQIGQKNGESIALGSLGLVYDSLGDYQRAIEHYEQSLALARELDNRQGAAVSLSNLAITYEKMGNYDRALPLYRQALALWRGIQGAGFWDALIPQDPDLTPQP